jgi:hypothetical protein
MREILNRTKIVNALGTKVLPDMFCVIHVSFNFPFQDLNGFFCKT